MSREGINHVFLLIGKLESQINTLRNEVAEISAGLHDRRTRRASMSADDLTAMDAGENVVLLRPSDGEST